MSTTGSSCTFQRVFQPSFTQTFFSPHQVHCNCTGELQLSQGLFEYALTKSKANIGSPINFLISVLTVKQKLGYE